MSWLQTKSLNSEGKTGSNHGGPWHSLVAFMPHCTSRGGPGEGAPREEVLWRGTGQHVLLDCFVALVSEKLQSWASLSLEHFRAFLGDGITSLTKSWGSMGAGRAREGGKVVLDFEMWASCLAEVVRVSWNVAWVGCWKCPRSSSLVFQYFFQNPLWCWLVRKKKEKYSIQNIRLD